MSLKQRLHEEWDRLVAHSTASGGPQQLTLNVNSGRLECTVVCIDQLACAFDQLAFRTSDLEQVTMDELKRIAANLSRRLSYLLESISPVETDREACTVQMRSNPPHKDDDGTSYYELVARRGELTLCRYAKSGGQVRRVIPAHVTREVFSRLCQDLSSIPELRR